MKTSVMMLTLTAAGILAAGAAATETPGYERSIVDRKAAMIRHVDERISRSQQEKACIKSASSFDDLETCREKFRPPRRQERTDRPEQRSPTE
jgi:hypothetical protein